MTKTEVGHGPGVPCGPPLLTPGKTHLDRDLLLEWLLLLLPLRLLLFRECLLRERDLG